MPSVENRRRVFVAGGAGFIGSHLVNTLLDTTDSLITVFDNLSNGHLWHFGARIKDQRLKIIEADARDQQKLVEAIRGHNFVYHFAANSDIARAQEEPAIDFNNGAIPTHNILEAMRITGVPRIVFTSGSGVYGEVGADPVAEEFDRMIPVSTYGACKLASEALIAAYSAMFGITGTVFRFANVVGPRQTHGVAYDFIRKLNKDPKQLLILGDGTQYKPYIHVDDILKAFFLLEKKQAKGYDVFNVGTPEHLTVREIADIVCERMGLRGVKYVFTGGNRGWKGDVPVYSLNTDKIRELGWTNSLSSREAVMASVDAMVGDMKSGKLA